MIEIIWLILILVSAVFSIVSGTSESFINGISDGAGGAVTLTVSIIGMMGFWSGIFALAEASGLSAALSRLLRPIIKFFFPKSSEDKELSGLIASNFAANILGIANAATPIGIKVVGKMGEKNYSHKELVCFVLFNTASIQLLPTNLAVLRSSTGSTEPYIIVAPVIICSFVSLTVIVLLCRIFVGNHDE